MSFLYPTLAILAVLAVFLFLIGRQNRDLLRVRAYGEFFLRLLPFLSTGVFILGLPAIMELAPAENPLPVLLVYLGGTVILAALMARLVAPDERRAVTLFRREEYEGAATAYERLIARRPLPRYYSALGACLDGAGDPYAALEAADTAIKLDPELGIAYYNRASARSALGEYSQARDDLHTIFTVDSNRRLRRAAEEALESLKGNS